MAPFCPGKCTYQMRLTLLNRQVLIATDNGRILEILTEVFGSRHFAPKPSEDRVTFYLSTQCDSPWCCVMAGPEGISVYLPSVERPMTFDRFLWSSAGVKRIGYCTYDEQRQAPSRDMTIELFAAHFQRRIFSALVRGNPSLRLVHAGSLSYLGSGLMLLAPTNGGKSTLTLAGLLAGMQFLSDDYSVVDLERGMIYPFPRALRLRKEARELVPDFARLCTGIVLDACGESRFYMHPERIRDDALGLPVKLAYIIRLISFADKASIRKGGAGAMVMNCVESDCFATGEKGLDLAWQWAGLMNGLSCALLEAGHPVETAELLRQFVEHG